MPYGKKKSGDKIQVVNKETGKVVGTHTSEASANKQIKALYVNEPKAKKKK